MFRPVIDIMGRLPAQNFSRVTCMYCLARVKTVVYKTCCVKNNNVLFCLKSCYFSRDDRVALD
jgi:hypothetical protein